MKRPERVDDYLEHIAEAIKRATSYLQPIQDLEAFKKNPQAQDAVVRNIEIMGEAVSKIGAPGRTSSNSIPSFHGRKCAECATSRSVSISLSIWKPCVISAFGIEYLTSVKLQATGRRGNTELRP